jgi:hypothetical protein
VKFVRDPIGVIALSLIAILLGYVGGGLAKFLSRARTRAA